MINLNKAYISQAIYLASNELDKRIRYKQEQAEEIFGSFISTQSQQTNVPDDADPSIPRIIFPNNHKQIFLSQIVSQLALSFDSANKTIEEQLSIVIKNTQEMHKKIVQFKGQESLKESAFIVVLNIPSNEQRSQISEFLFSKFINMPRIAEIASSSMKVGYLLNKGIFLNIEADVYEKRGGQMQSAQPLQLDEMMNLPVIEMGISVKIDINSRPKAMEAGYVNDGPEELIDLMKSYLPGEIYNLLQAG